MSEVAYKCLMTIAVLIMGGIGLPKAIEKDHYVALLIWIYVFISLIRKTFRHDAKSNESN